MDDEHCVIAVISFEVAKFNRAADKTLSQRLFYMSCRLPWCVENEGRAMHCPPLAPVATSAKRRCKNTNFLESGKFFFNVSLLIPCIALSI
ncbi:MAG: hypothetical protein IJK07_00280 [Bacteroidales bacterium]|nr:hypothetical protein [Bacteroidales bacterium]